MGERARVRRIGDMCEVRSLSTGEVEGVWPSGWIFDIDGQEVEHGRRPDGTTVYLGWTLDELYALWNDVRHIDEVEPEDLAP